MASFVSKARLLDLAKTQCNLFQTIFNPSRIRMGNKILRQRLKGAALAGYYPRRPATMADIQKEFKRYDMEVYDEDEEYRLEGLQIAKLRGKGAPKKKTTANTTKRRGGKKK